MKDSIRLTVFSLGFASLMAAAMYFPTINADTRIQSPEQVSWIEFCKARGYDSETSDTAVIDEYLDTWVGSIEEEHVFNNLPAMED